jgi:hypothetical protein
MSESRSQVENVKLAGVVNEVEVTITGQRQVHGQAGPILDAQTLDHIHIDLSSPHYRQALHTFILSYRSNSSNNVSRIH